MNKHTLTQIVIPKQVCISKHVFSSITSIIRNFNNYQSLCPGPVNTCYPWKPITDFLERFQRRIVCRDPLRILSKFIYDMVGLATSMPPNPLWSLKPPNRPWFWASSPEQGCLVLSTVEFFFQGVCESENTVFRLANRPTVKSMSPPTIFLWIRQLAARLKQHV